MARPRTPLLSADRIADAAIALVDANEPFGVNALARRLGVTPSSLYHHVSGLDEIVELVRGRLAREYVPDIEPGRPWDAVVDQVVRAQRTMFADHPNLLPLLVGKTVTDPTVLGYYDAVATALVDAGLPDDEVLVVVAMLDALALGSALDLSAPDEVWHTDDTTTTLGRLLVGADSGATRSDRAFDLGLAMLVDGLRARLSSPIRGL